MSFGACWRGLYGETAKRCCAKPGKTYCYKCRSNFLIDDQIECIFADTKDLRASAKNKYTIWLVLWSVCCVASTSTYPPICTGRCALHTDQNTAKSGAFIFFRDPKIAARRDGLLSIRAESIHILCRHRKHKAFYLIYAKNHQRIFHIYELF